VVSELCKIKVSPIFAISCGITNATHNFKSLAIIWYKICNLVIEIELRCRSVCLQVRAGACCLPAEDNDGP